ncbi:hypothetical protein [Saprospira grandis]|uniref:Uncharacterized protein n=1 Tax=Saprospira grandis (strain Lewin) TaxID=984262 RepID=H6L305_SAPGL|nr:hypothetical protein [Saprospira grandis]AFC23732.1 hypothetical protein SGRA_0997 [Saprospira grandis str. Lewin]
MNQFQHWQARLFRKEQAAWSYIVEPIPPYWFVPLQIVFFTIFILNLIVMVLAALFELEIKLLINICSSIFFGSFALFFLAGLLLAYKNEDYIWYPKFCISDQQLKILSRGLGLSLFKEDMQRIQSASIIKKTLFKKEVYQLVLQLTDGQQRLVPYCLQSKENLAVFLNLLNREESPELALVDQAAPATIYIQEEEELIILAQQDPDISISRRRIVAVIAFLAFILGTGLCSALWENKKILFEAFPYLVLGIASPFILWLIYEQYRYMSNLKMVISPHRLALKRPDWPFPLATSSIEQLGQIEIVQKERNSFELEFIAMDGKIIKAPIVFQQYEQAAECKKQILALTHFKAL